MPMFFVVPMWLLGVLLAVALLFFKTYRFLATYIATCSTGALLGSISFCLGLLSLARFVPEGGSEAVMFLTAVFGATVLGGAGGTATGFLIARWFNRQVGWKSPAKKPMQK
jgi:hypothetical protein